MEGDISLRDLMRVLIETQNEVRQGNEEVKHLKATIDDFKEQLTAVVTKVDKLEVRQNQLEASLQAISQHVEKLSEEREQSRYRDKNVIMFGFPHIPDENRRTLEAAVMEALNTKLGNDIRIHEIDSIRRIGARNSPNRPVLIRFLSFRAKLEVLQSARSKPEAGIRLSWDYSPEERATRRALWPYIANARERGEQARYKGDRALIAGRVYTLRELQERGGGKESSANRKTKFKPEDVPAAEEVTSDSEGSSKRRKFATRKNSIKDFLVPRAGSAGQLNIV